MFKQKSRIGQGVGREKNRSQRTRKQEEMRKGREVRQQLIKKWLPLPSNLFRHYRFSY